jgi:hypothetical protein
VEQDVVPTVGSMLTTRYDSVYWNDEEYWSLLGARGLLSKCECNWHPLSAKTAVLGL